MNTRKSAAAKTAADESVSESWDKLTDQLDQLRSDLSALNSAAKDFARAGASEGQDRVAAEIEDLTARMSALKKQLGAGGRQMAHDAGEQAGILAREFEGTINRNPFTAMLVALGVGFVIGMSSRGRR